MRLYHALLVTAVALLASNASAGRADCDMIPGDVIESSSGSVEQGSTANSAVDASQASQASQGSAPDTPEQQYSQTASASGSAPKDSFDGYDASNDSPIQQGSAVDASQASQGSAPSDETPVQQYSTTNSGASQPASASGSAPKDSFDGYDASNDSPVQQGSAVDASQASQGSAPSDETPVQQFSTTNSQGSAPSDASFTSSYPGPTPDFPEYSQGSAPADFPEYGQGSAPTDSPAQQFSTANSDVGSSQVNQGSAPTDASFTSSYVGPTPDFPEYDQGSAPTESPVQQFSTANSDVGASQVNQGSAPSDETPVQQFSTANSDVGASQVNQGSAPSDETPVQQFSTTNSASQASGSDDVQQGVVVPGGDVEDASQKTDVAGESDINFKTTLAPTATTAAPEVAASSSGSSASNSTVTTSSTGFCAKPRVRITEVDVGAAIENNEEEAALKVIAIAALPSGGSRIAFQSGDNVIVRELDANDKLVASSPAVKVPMNDFADIYADKNGFVILGTRDAEGGGTLNCGNPSNLCGGGPSPASPCYDMYMARYDGTSEKWATKLTSSSASLPPYSTGKTGPDVYMIWWYAHHGRIAYDGTNWAAYFGAAISTSEGGCINIHQGDRMKVVSPSGAITDSEDSFDWGCSHSGYERITYDERSKSFASICKTDSNNRLMPPNNWDATIYPVNLAASDLGDIVPDSVASSNKYWSAVSNGDGDNAKVHLIHYDLKSQASEDIVLGGTDANERAPHLAAMGKDGMLAMWEGSSAGGDLQEGSDRTIYAQVLNRATGKALSEKITVDKSVVGNRYQALKSYPDGSVAYLSKGKTGTSVQVVRFFGC